MPKDVKFEQPLKEELVQDEKKIAEAKSGADIYCSFCGNRNPENAKNCLNCGAALAEGEARESGQKYAAQVEPVPETIKCEVCGTDNPVNSLTCSSCGSPLKTSYIPTSEPPVNKPSAPSGKKGRFATGGCVIAGVVILVLLLIAGYFLFMKTEQSTAIVTNTRWKTQVEVLALVEKTGHDWYDSIPLTGTIGECTEKVRQTSDNYVAGATEVCGEPYLVDKGNGYSEKVQDCSYEVYDDYCSYTYRDWGVYELKTAAGEDKTPRLPQIYLSSDQKQGSEYTTFDITLRSNDGSTYTYTPSSVSEYQTFNVNDEYQIEVNGVGSLVSLEKK